MIRWLLTISIFRETSEILQALYLPLCNLLQDLDEAVGYPLGQLMEWDEVLAFLASADSLAKGGAGPDIAKSFAGELDAGWPDWIETFDEDVPESRKGEKGCVSFLFTMRCKEI